ncbi:MAG: hypothetical protein K0Q73_4906 [Paenibacillus sp.]|jgi:hypothetical protein|nr:hypothetical protein [Paenibacillus sp.]
MPDLLFKAHSDILLHFVQVIWMNLFRITTH